MTKPSKTKKYESYLTPALTTQTSSTQWHRSIPCPFPCHQKTLCPARTSATVTAKVSLRRCE